MLSGFIFFLKTHTKKTVLVVLVLLGSVAFVANDYFSSKQELGKFHAVEKSIKGLEK